MPYFYMGVLTPGGGNADPTVLALPLRLLSRPQRTGQGLEDEAKNTGLEHTMEGSRNTSLTLRSAVTNQLYDQLLLNNQINPVYQPRSFTPVM